MAIFESEFDPSLRPSMEATEDDLVSLQCRTTRSSTRSTLNVIPDNRHLPEIPLHQSTYDAKVAQDVADTDATATSGCGGRRKSALGKATATSTLPSKKQQGPRLSNMFRQLDTLQGMQQAHTSVKENSPVNIVMNECEPVAEAECEEPTPKKRKSSEVALSLPAESSEDDCANLEAEEDQPSTSFQSDKAMDDSDESRIEMASEGPCSEENKMDATNTAAALEADAAVAPDVMDVGTSDEGLAMGNATPALVPSSSASHPVLSSTSGARSGIPKFRPNEATLAAAAASAASAAVAAAAEVATLEADAIAAATVAVSATATPQESLQAIAETQDSAPESAVKSVPINANLEECDGEKCAGVSDSKDTFSEAAAVETAVEAAAAAWSSMRAYMAQEGGLRPLELFRSIDKDRSGKIDANEFQAALKLMGIPVRACGVLIVCFTLLVARFIFKRTESVPFSSAFHYFHRATFLCTKSLLCTKTSSQDPSLDTARAIISTADPNSDGMLDYKELLAVLKPPTKAKLGGDAAGGAAGAAAGPRPPMVARNPLKALVAQSRSRTSSLGSNHSGITTTSASFEAHKGGEVATTPSSEGALPPVPPATTAAPVAAAVAAAAAAGLTTAGAFSAPSSLRPAAQSRVGALSPPVVALAASPAAATASSSTKVQRAPLSASSSINRSAVAAPLELPVKSMSVEKAPLPRGSAGNTGATTPATSKELADLEARKAAAVASEDYVTAAQIKDQILALTAATAATAATATLKASDANAKGEAARLESTTLVAAPGEVGASGASFDSAVTQALPSKRNSNPFAHLLRKA